MPRLDLQLATQYPEHSRSKLQKYIEAGFVTVNNKVVTETKFAVTQEDALVLAVPTEATELVAEYRELDIIFEDNDLLVINKPTGMVVHPQNTEETGSLIQAVLGLRPEIRETVYDPENPISKLRPGIVHRLDKDTTGVIIIAKTKFALEYLTKQFHDHKVQKFYQALLFGELHSQTVDIPLHRQGTTAVNRMVASATKPGRAAKTSFETLRIWEPQPGKGMISQARVQIFTGRTHQIRAHAKFIGNPVMGDQIYGHKTSMSLSEKLGLTRQQLHAESITITHPTTQHPITFAADPTFDLDLLG